MQLSPLDIRKQTFKRTLRGVDPEEVRMFLELVASEFEKVVQENAMMAEKISYQEERLEEYRDLEKSLRNSLVTAERIASESREASDREAQRVIQDAHSRAERILEDSRERLQRLVHEVEVLSGKKETYVRRFRAMLEGQLSVLSEHDEQFSEIDSIADDARQALVRSGARESFERTVRKPAREPQAETTMASRSSAPGATAAGPAPGARRVLERVAAGPVGAPTRSFPRSTQPDEPDWGTRAEAELPFDERHSYDAAEASGGDPEAFFQVQERREGFFHVDASEELDPYDPRRAE